MPFSAYDFDALRVLSAALSDTLDTLRKSAGRPLPKPKRRIEQEACRKSDGGL